MKAARYGRLPWRLVTRVYMMMYVMRPFILSHRDGSYSGLIEHSAFGSLQTMVRLECGIQPMTYVMRYVEKVMNPEQQSVLAKFRHPGRVHIGFPEGFQASHKNSDVYI